MYINTFKYVHGYMCIQERDVEKERDGRTSRTRTTRRAVSLRSSLATS